jgi:hypothetical protein
MGTIDQLGGDYCGWLYKRPFMKTNEKRSLMTGIWNSKEAQYEPYPTRQPVFLFSVGEEREPLLARSR